MVLRKLFDALVVEWVVSILSAHSCKLKTSAQFDNLVFKIGRNLGKYTPYCNISF